MRRGSKMRREPHRGVVGVHENAYSVGYRSRWPLPLVVMITDFWGTFSEGLRCLLTSLVVSDVFPYACNSIFLEEPSTAPTDSINYKTSNLGFIATLCLEVEPLIFFNKPTVLDISRMVICFTASAAKDIVWLNTSNDFVLCRWWGCFLRLIR